MESRVSAAYARRIMLVSGMLRRTARSGMLGAAVRPCAALFPVAVMVAPASRSRAMVDRVICLLRGVCLFSHLHFFVRDQVDVRLRHQIALFYVQIGHDLLGAAGALRRALAG